jgi:hypothetical protein
VNCSHPATHKTTSSKNKRNFCDSLKTSDDGFSAPEKTKYVEDLEIRLEMRDAEREKIWQR